MFVCDDGTTPTAEVRWGRHHGTLLTEDYWAEPVTNIPGVCIFGQLDMQDRQCIHKHGLVDLSPTEPRVFFLTPAPVPLQGVARLRRGRGAAARGRVRRGAFGAGVLVG